MKRCKLSFASINSFNSKQLLSWLGMLSFLLPTTIGFSLNAPDTFSSIPIVGTLLDETGGPIKVQIEQSFPGVTPQEVKSAWLSYQWEKGGGLLGAAVLLSDSKSKRRLLPVFMEETLNDNLEEEKKQLSTKEENEVQVEYSITDMGLLSSELKDGTHSATVTFALDDETIDTDDCSTKMVWDVSFEANHRRDFWKSFTQTNLQTVTSNLVSYLATPQLYKRTTNLTWNPSSFGNKDIIEEWIHFVWDNGGGLPIPNFMLLSLGNGKRMYVPPFLIESIQSVQLLDASNDGKTGEIRYRVDTPDFLFAHTHAGRVKFEKKADLGVEMIWEVEARPYRRFDLLVNLLFSSIISNLARNFKNHLLEPDATVAISLPQGEDGVTELGQISKNSWVGGVLAAQSSDQRSAIEQTLSLLQPWTWGRGSGYDEDGEGEVLSTGFMTE